MNDRPNLRAVLGEHKPPPIGSRIAEFAETKNAERNAPRDRLTPIPWSAIHLLPKRSPLIDGLLDCGGMSLLYGFSGCGKTFFALDLSAHVALGWEWRGREVKSGAVVYIAAEGGLGLEERLTAFRHHHDTEIEGVPFYIIPEPIDLCRSTEDTKILLERIAALPAQPPLSLIVVDTLSRAMSGGNENSPDDMGAFVRHCDRLRMETKAHVLVIHHAGKDDSRGARGHSLLKAAADTEIEVAKSETTGLGTATVTKQRDYRGGESLAFRLEPIDINDDRTACVLVPTDESPATSKTRKGTRLTKGAQIAQRALRKALDEAGVIPPTSNHIPPNTPTVSLELWRKYAYGLGISGSDEARAKQLAFSRSSEALFAAGLVGTWQGQCWSV
jgi:hypothetical protein